MDDNFSYIQLHLLKEQAVKTSKCHKAPLVLENLVKPILYHMSILNPSQFNINYKLQMQQITTYISILY